jgi:uncharacterized membrane protein HdeD (DUF308 family)
MSTDTISDDTVRTRRDRYNVMNANLADNWWIVALRGVFALAFAACAIFIPGVTMISMVLLFGAYSLVDGIFSIALAVRGARRHERWGMLLLNGILGILAGVVALLWPGISVIALVVVIAAWALISSGLSVAAAIQLKRDHGRWWLVLGAVASFIYGVLLLIAPLIGALVLTWWIGAHALVLGVTLIALAFQLRTHRGERPHGLAPAQVS